MSRLEEVHQAAVKAEQDRLVREALAELDRDFPRTPTCEQEYHAGVYCGQNAKYIARCRFCDDTAYACGECVSRLYALDRRGGINVCTKCMHPETHLWDLVEFFPIGHLL